MFNILNVHSNTSTMKEDKRYLKLFYPSIWLCRTFIACRAVHVQRVACVRLLGFQENRQRRKV